MDIDRFLAKPVEVEIAGEKVMIKPLTTEFYPLVVELSYYDNKLLSAKSKLKEGEEMDLTSILTPKELSERAEVELEIAYRTMDSTFEGMTKEKFNQMNITVIEEIMKGAMKANGLTDEKIDKVRALLKPDAE